MLDGHVQVFHLKGLKFKGLIFLHLLLIILSGWTLLVLLFGQRIYQGKQ